MRELNITWKDWGSVFLTGMSFSAFLSLLVYHLLGLRLSDGVIFGLLLGFFIALFSLIFVKEMNCSLLPLLRRRWWNITAAFFSFLAGFLGALSTYIACVLFPSSFMVVPLYQLNPFSSASILGALTYLLGRLMYRFVQARNEKEHSDALFMQSRLRSLETQLNPHFLFNALNSLTELVHQDPKKAEDAIIKLSTFLRSSMEEKPLISLVEELKNVNDYLDVERLRFPTLQLKKDVPTEAMRRLIPKFSIQLLIENAIKHGYDASICPFEITIEVKLEEDKLHIYVSNNGKAISKETFGIGLSNLKERLSFLCGGSVELLSREPVVYHITLKECHEASRR